MLELILNKLNFVVILEINSFFLRLLVFFHSSQSFILANQVGEFTTFAVVVLNLIEEEETFYACYVCLIFIFSLHFLSRYFFRVFNFSCSLLSFK